MSNTDDIRWQQRLENFGKALQKLENACQQKEYSELERAGLIQMFEMTFELAWKCLKDLLFVEGFDEKSPNGTIRRSFEMEYLSEEHSEAFLDALRKRNLLSHTYEEKTAEEAVKYIKETYFPALKAAHETLKEKQSS